MKLVKYSKTIYQNLTIMKQSIILLWYGVWQSVYCLTMAQILKRKYYNLLKKEICRQMTKFINNKN